METIYIIAADTFNLIFRSVSPQCLTWASFEWKEWNPTVRLPLYKIQAAQNKCPTCICDTPKSYI